LLIFFFSINSVGGHKMTGNLSLYLFLSKYGLSFNSCVCVFAYQWEWESRKTLKPFYQTRSSCKQHRVNGVESKSTPEPFG